MKDGVVDGDENGSEREQTLDQSETPSLSQDNVFAVLSSKRCRYVLFYLQTVESSAEVSSLVEAVAEWETGNPIDHVSEDHRQRVLTSLRHAHLPKLSAMGLVEYDEAEDVVRRGPYVEQVETYLEIAAERDEDVTP